MKNCLVFLSVVFAACAGHFTGNLQIDGEPFAATGCRSGQVSGFSGVELSDDHGRRLRLAQNLDGTFAGVYFSPDSRIGDNLGTCGTLNVQPETSVVNGVHPVEGSVTLTCKTEKHQLSGRGQFENCR
jgi:hypothetical protein